MVEGFWHERLADHIDRYEDRRNGNNRQAPVFGDSTLQVRRTYSLVLDFFGPEKLLYATSLAFFFGLRSVFIGRTNERRK